MRVSAAIAYAGCGIARPRYYANDHSRDALEIVRVQMDVSDARHQPNALDDGGFVLLAHTSAIADFANRETVDAIHRQEIVELIAGVSGAHQVLVNSPGILRFSERSASSGMLDNSRPARFAHVDVSDATAATFGLSRLGFLRTTRNTVGIGFPT
jgi:hypothetical protein